MEVWLKKKRDTDNAEGLWRIGDKIYDLTSWAQKHPGGSHWIENTKGTDITELFETHHISPYPATILSNFEVRDAKTARSYPYTFYPDGFYNRLKQRIHAKLDTLPRKKIILLKSFLITDCLVTVTLILSVLAAKYVSLFIATCAAVTLALSTICSHNFLHSHDNWRMYYFCLSSLSIKNWRITHIVSHHMHTNSADDLEITLFKPFFEWLPTSDKFWFSKNLAQFYAPVVYLFTTIKEVLERILRQNNEPSDLIVFITPTLMYLFSSESILTVITVWIWIIMFCSLIFVFIGVTAGHHHPEIYHEGDVRRKDQDWGLYQVDAVRDRIETKQNAFLSLITFGDHGMHHLFPTIDQALLPYLYSELEITCQEFGIERKDFTAWQLIRGQFQQLSRTKPNLKKSD